MSDTSPAAGLFPSGPWTGFYLAPNEPGRHQMELRLTFSDGHMTGEGRDRIGQFTVDGTYATDTGKCAFTKQYVGKHAVHYAGYNEGKGIWGTWNIGNIKGGFHIWPEGMADPTVQHLSEEAEVPTDGEMTKKRKKKPQRVGEKL